MSSWRAVVLSTAFRLACYVLALWLMLFAEARAAPHLPDAVLELVPYVAWVDRYNYLLWLGAYVPIAIALLFKDRARFVRYSVSAGLLALIRALCILTTGLGPVRGDDVNAGMNAAQRWQAFVQLLDPFGFFSFEGGARVWLTKDLFFSGHTGTTFLLLLYVWPYPVLRRTMLATHVLVVTSVFFSHLHYTIDVIGAYAITFCLFYVRELRGGRLSLRTDPPSSTLDGAAVETTTDGSVGRVSSASHQSTSPS